MGGNLQKVAAACVATWALAGTCRAEMPGSVAPSSAVPLLGGWTARFYVSPVTSPHALRDETLVRRNETLGINAQLSRKLSRNTRVTVEVLNALDRESTTATGLIPSPAGRGIQFGFRATFE